MNDYWKKIIEQLWSLSRDYREEIIKEILDKASRSNEDGYIYEYLKTKETDVASKNSSTTQLSSDHAARNLSQNCSTPCEKPVPTATCESSIKESDPCKGVDEDGPSISLWEAFDDIDTHEGFSKRRKKAQKESSVECLGRKEASKPTCKSPSNDSNNHENDEGDVGSDVCLWDAYDDIEVPEDLSQSPKRAEEEYSVQRFCRKKTFEEKFFKKYPDAQSQIFEHEAKVHVLESQQWMLESDVSASEIDGTYTAMYNNMFRDVVRECNLQPHTASFAFNSSPLLDEDDDIMVIPTIIRSNINRNRNRILSDSESDGSDNVIDPDDNQPSISAGQRHVKRPRMSTLNRAKKPRRVSDDDSEDEMDVEPWDLLLYTGESDDGEMEVDKVKKIREEKIHPNSATNIDSEPCSRRKRSVDGEGKQSSSLGTEHKFSIKEKQLKPISSMNNEICASIEDKMTVNSDIQEAENIPPGSNVPNSVKSPLKGGRKNIRDLKDDAEITKVSRRANEREKKRMQRVMRITELLEACPATKVEKRLILDVDPKTHEPRVEVHPELVKHLKDHQFEGIQFMYTNTIENVDLLKEDNEGTGCIIAHCMGLGKTLQVIAYVHTILNHPLLKIKFRKIMIAAPVNTLKNWYDEFRKWLPNPDASNIYQITDLKDNLSRAKMLGKWYDQGGVLIIGLQGFTKLSKLFNCKTTNIPSALKNIEAAFINPGPDILVIDEGHLLKNDESENFQAFCRVPTERKIILTGTPLQNNLEEYYTMIDLIKPRLLGTKKEFANRFKNPIENAQHYDSTHGDIWLMKERCAVLEKLLTGSIQRFDYEVLKPYLEPKYEYAIFVQATDLVVELYNYYLDNISMTCRNRNILDDSNLLRLICNHPAVLPIRSEKQAKSAALRVEKNRQKSVHKEIKESTNQECYRSVEPHTHQITGIREDLFGESCETISNTGSESDMSAQLRDKSIDDNSAEWFRKFMKDEENFQKIELSAKFVVFFFILQQCVIKNEKSIAVSQCLKTLDLIEEFLASHKKIRSSSTQAREIEWVKDKSYFRIDGSVSSDKRKLYIDTFNNPNNREAKMFLLAVKAGGLGVNLIGANRAIIFDTHWNPMIDMQAIFRIYRLGQTKPTYIYRLITKDTMEEKVYLKQILKTRLSMRVVDKTNIQNSVKKADVEEYYSIRPQKLTETKEFPTIPKDDLLGDLILAHKESIFEYREQDSLLQKKPEENLDKHQRRKAWEDYKKELGEGNTIEEEKTEANLDKIESSETDFLKDNQVKTYQPSSFPTRVTPIVEYLQNLLSPHSPTPSHESNENIPPTNRIVPKIDCGITGSVSTNSPTLTQASIPSTSMGTTTEKFNVHMKDWPKKNLTPVKPISSLESEASLNTSARPRHLSSIRLYNSTSPNSVSKLDDRHFSNFSNPLVDPPGSTFPALPSNVQQHPLPPPVTESHRTHPSDHEISIILNEKSSIINDEDLSNGLFQGLSLVDCSLFQLCDKLANSSMRSRAVDRGAILKTIQDCLEDLIHTVRDRKFQASVSNSIVNLKLASSCDKILRHLDKQLPEAKISDPVTGVPFVFDRVITRGALNIIALRLVASINSLDEINRRDKLCDGEKLAQ